MQKEENTLLTAMVHCVIALGFLSLAGLMAIAAMAHSVPGMRFAVFVSGLAYVAQVLLTWAAALTNAGFAARTAYYFGVMLWGVVCGAFLVGVWFIS